MKRTVIIFLLIISTSVAGAPEVNNSPLSEKKDCLSDWEMLELAIAMTESRFNPDAEGRAEDCGIFQIRPIYVKEVNRISGKNFTKEDAFSVEKSLEMFNLLQGHYNPERDIERAIYYHNKSSQYKIKVMQNYEFVRRYESMRESVAIREKLSL